jgi:Spy/CpxP family protein refolding chaperone
MDETQNTTNTPEREGASPDEPVRGSCRRPRGRKILFGLLVGVLGAFLVLPFAFARAGFGGCEPKSPEQAKEKASFVADKLLDRVDATDAQRDEVDALIDEIIPDLFAMKKDGRALKERIHEALMAEPVNAEELESLRQEAMAMADKASKKATESVLRISEILTPEQRAEIHQMMKEKRERWHGHHGCGHEE